MRLPFALLLLLSLASGLDRRAAAKTRPVPCPPGRFLIAAADRPLLPPGGGGAIVGDSLEVGGAQLVLDGCGVTTAKLVARRRFTLVRAKWNACGAFGRVRMKARISAPACATLTGTLRTRGSKPKAFSALRSTCGDGVLDPDREECDASAPDGDLACAGSCGAPGSPDACSCPILETTTTTTTSATGPTSTSTTTTSATTSSGSTSSSTSTTTVGSSTTATTTTLGSSTTSSPSTSTTSTIGGSSTTSSSTTSTTSTTKTTTTTGGPTTTTSTSATSTTSTTKTTTTTGGGTTSTSTTTLASTTSTTSTTKTTTTTGGATTTTSTSTTSTTSTTKTTTTSVSTTSTTSTTKTTTTTGAATTTTSTSTTSTTSTTKTTTTTTTTTTSTTTTIPALRVELSWDHSLDMDLQLVVGSSGFSLLDDGLRCFWGNRQPTDPAWGGADPVFLSDDLAACKPEVIAMPPPPAGKDYEVFAHYYCDRRGHDELSGNVCYEPTEQLTTATATVNLYGNNVLLQTFSRSLALSDAWQVANLHRESNGTWTITPVDTVVTQAASDCVGNPACTCDQLGNPDDAYCGVGGAACRAMYP